MTKDEMLVYLDHFNNQRYDAVTSYFADDVTVGYATDFKLGAPPASVRHGSGQFVEHYKELHPYVDEIIDLEDFMASDDGKYVFVSLHTEFLAKVDYDGFSAGPLKKGDAFVINDFVLYELNEKGQFQNIRIAHHGVDYPGKPRHSARV
jgi:hypothetical protein